MQKEVTTIFIRVFNSKISFPIEISFKSSPISRYIDTVLMILVAVQFMLFTLVAVLVV